MEPDGSLGVVLNGEQTPGGGLYANGGEFTWKERIEFQPEDDDKWQPDKEGKAKP